MASKKKRVRYPIHKMGKHCGYNEYEDGSIEVAPKYSKPMLDIATKEQGINAMLEAVSAHAAAMHRDCQTTRDRIWDDMADDYGLDHEKYAYSLNRRTGRLSRKLRQEPSEN